MCEIQFIFLPILIPMSLRCGTWCTLMQLMRIAEGCFGSRWCGLLNVSAWDLRGYSVRWRDSNNWQKMGRAYINISSRWRRTWTEKMKLKSSAMVLMDYLQRFSSVSSTFATTKDWSKAWTVWANLLQSVGSYASDPVNQDTPLGKVGAHDFSYFLGAV